MDSIIEAAKLMLKWSLFFAVLGVIWSLVENSSFYQKHIKNRRESWIGIAILMLFVYAAYKGGQ